MEIEQRTRNKMKFQHHYPVTGHCELSFPRMYCDSDRVIDEDEGCSERLHVNDHDVKQKACRGGVRVYQYWRLDVWVD